MGFLVGHFVSTLVLAYNLPYRFRLLFDLHDPDVRKILSNSALLTGTGLMALVVVKLFLVDLGNTGTVARIVSFLGVGVMLLVVGYFAPAPPKRKSAAQAATEE